MNPQQFAQIAELFDALIDLPIDQRSAVLAAQCQDAVLREAVMKLLAADAVDSDILDAAVTARHDMMTELPIDSLCVGLWRAQALIGRGGMGLVYRVAREDAHYHQQGALKLIPQGMHSVRIVARFMRERQLLARLDHPNIVRLIDGGISAQGQPYLVMEYVDGMPLRQYVVEHKPDARARIALLLQLCAAVAYAHRQLIVHRDVKPANVMIDQHGNARLLDFGIAKLLDASNEHLTLTQHGPLTPHYAAPEQRMGGIVTTATDVFGLGAVLHELMTGLPPWRNGQPDDEPRTLPSALVANAASNEFPRIAARQLRGDLDTICLKALAGEPERRYTSADALADDLRGVLEGRPIAARRDSLPYRIGKFAARNRIGVAFSAIAILATALALASSIRQTQIAQVEAGRSRSIQEFLVGLFQVARPADTPGGYRLTAKEMVDIGSQRLQAGSTDPTWSAELALVVGTVYAELGETRRAIELLEHQAASLPEGERQAERYVRLANAYIELEDGAAAQRYAEQALKQADTAGARGLQWRASALVMAAEAARSQNQAERARLLGADAIAAARRIPGRPSTILGDALVAQAGAYWAEHRNDEARPLIEQAIATYVAADAKQTQSYGQAVMNLGILMQQAGERDSAADQYTQALSIYRTLLPEQHLDIVNLLATIANLDADRGNYADAISRMRQAIDMAHGIVGDRHPMLAGLENGLSSFHSAVGDYTSGIAALKRAIAIETTLGLSDSTMACTHRVNLARLLGLHGELGEAEPIARAALTDSARINGTDSPFHAQALVVLGSIRRARGFPTEALDLQSQAETIEGRLSGIAVSRRVRTQLQLAETELDLRRATLAQSRLQRLLATPAAIQQLDVLQRAEAQMLYAEALLSVAQNDSARAAARNAIDLYRTFLSDTDGRRLRAQALLAIADLRLQSSSPRIKAAVAMSELIKVQGSGNNVTTRIGALLDATPSLP